MFRYAVRRILWSIPTLAATSLVLFFVTTLVPNTPVTQRAGEGSDPGAWARAKPGDRASLTSHGF